MRKRGSERGQLSKEDYNTLEDGASDDDGEVNENSNHWKPASSDKLEGRRFAKVRTPLRRPVSNGSSTPGENNSASASKSKSSATTFSGFSFGGKNVNTTNTTPSTSILPRAFTEANDSSESTPSTSSNPFATVSLRAVPNLSSHTSKMGTLSGQSTKMTESKTVTESLPPTSNDSSNDIERRQKRSSLLCKIYQRTMEEILRDPTANLKPLSMQYISYLNKFGYKAGGYSQNRSSAVPSPDAANKATTSRSDIAPDAVNRKIQSNASLPRFSLTQPSDGSKATGASMTTETPKVAPPVPFKGFSFGKVNAGVPDGKSFAPPGRLSSSKKDQQQGEPEKEVNGFSADAREEPIKSSNENERTLYEVRAKLYKTVSSSEGDGASNDWKESGTGVLRLLQTTNTSPMRHHAVLRNDVGKVMLNIAVTDQMKFYKQQQKKVATIKFIAVVDREHGPEKLMLRVNEKNLDELHTHLQSMSTTG